MEITINVNDKLKKVLDEVVVENQTTNKEYIENSINSQLAMIYKNRIIQPITNSDYDSLSSFEDAVKITVESINQGK